MKIYLPRLSELNPSSLGNFIKYLKEIKIDEGYIYNLELINDGTVDENHGSDPTSDDHENLTDSELQNLCRLALDLSAPPIKN
tara:strand:+ start:289 stop:537 length:249 start_codon:yes stop_codon:yes gene_type:complete